jgi:hypothetical protein
MRPRLQVALDILSMAFTAAFGFLFLRSDDEIDDFYI